MKVSLNWLRELVDLPRDVAVDDVARRLTLAGLEVEGIDKRGRELSGVVVAEVRAVRPHPGAEKLRLVLVNAGGEEKEVVCGASNVPGPGGRVAWAPPGARLPGGRVLERREIRGVVSPGMLCSEKELGLSEESEGIVILGGGSPVGTDLAAQLGLVDDVLEVNVTPNRADALSHLGIAREVAAAFNVPSRAPATDAAPTVPGEAHGVTIVDANACPRYLAQALSQVAVGPSPLSMRVRLAACGVRSISNVVDVTNYVLMETGQPLHAFDRAAIHGGIIVRRADGGERLKTLDGVERILGSDDVVIADERGPLALAGVMGGAESEVSTGTTEILLEAATFDPVSIRRTARRLGLHSEASHRFERGVDAEGIPHAAARATALIARLAGAKAVHKLTDHHPGTQERRPIVLSSARLDGLAGVAIPLPEAASRLAALGIGARVHDDAIEVRPPSFRADLQIPEDVVEEVLRTVGLDRVPARLPASRTAPLSTPEGPADRARHLLSALGFSDVATWAFVPRGWLAAAGRDDGQTFATHAVRVKNPISADYEFMRTTLLPGLLDVARRNLTRGVSDPRLFEVGPVVRSESGAVNETTVAAALMCGRREGWLKPGEPLDYFDARQMVEELLLGLGVRRVTFRPRPAARFLHPGLSADVAVVVGNDAHPVGCVGEVHPKVARAFDLPSRETCLYFEVRVADVVAHTKANRAVPTPRFPSVARDLSFWIDAHVTASDQRAAFRSAGEPLLREFIALEDFRDPQYAPAGKKGMLWSFVYRADDRTLTDAEADAAHAEVIAALRAAHRVEIR